MLCNERKVQRVGTSSKVAGPTGLPEIQITATCKHCCLDIDLIDEKSQQQSVYIQDCTAHPASQGSLPFCYSRAMSVSAPSSSLKLCYPHLQLCKSLEVQLKTQFFYESLPSQSNKNHRSPRTSLQNHQAIPTRCRASLIAMPC